MKNDSILAKIFGEHNSVPIVYRGRYTKKWYTFLPGKYSHVDVFNNGRRFDTWNEAIQKALEWHKNKP